MMLLTKENRRRLPELYSTEKVADPMVHVKFFTPWTSWTWYATEFDGKDTFFGWVVGHEKELGYFSLKELESVRGPYGLTIERDRYFRPRPLSEVKKLHGVVETHSAPAKATKKKLSPRSSVRGLR